jgi:hypothetical protein
MAFFIHVCQNNPKNGLKCRKSAWMPAQSATHFGLVVYALRKLQQGQIRMDGVAKTAELFLLL